MKNKIKLFPILLFFLSIFFIKWTSWNEETRFAVVRAIVDEKRFEIDSFSNRTGEKILINNHYYSEKPIGFPLLAIAPYALLRGVSSFIKMEDKDSLPFIYFANDEKLIYYKSLSLFTSLAMIIVTVSIPIVLFISTSMLLYRTFYWFSERKRDSFLITWVYAIGSPALVYSGVFTEHLTLSFFLLLAFVVLFKFRFFPKFRYFFLSGLLNGFSLFIQYTAVVALIPTLLYLKDIKKILYWLKGFVVGSLPLLTYNILIFKTPFGIPYLYVTTHPFPAFTMTGILPTLDVTILPKILLFPYRGLFFYYPIFILSFLGIYRFIKQKRDESIYIILIITLYLVILAAHPFWWGGVAFGPVFLVSILPFLTLPILSIIHKINFKLFVLLLLPSIFSNLLSLQMWESPPMYFERIYEMENVHLANPLIEYYLPLLLKNGPRPILFENLVKEFKFDIRLTPHSLNLIPLTTTSVGNN